MKRYTTILAILSAFGLAELAFVNVLPAQNYWQQHVDYKIDVDLDVITNRYNGKVRIVYQNNSPDTLNQVFFHLYNNAFQPGSMMDMRSRTIADPDRRVGDRIFGLTESEAGYLHVRELKQDGKATRPVEIETILQVPLDHALLPKGTTTFDLEFEGQVPTQIRRSGRDNREGIRYSMSQWYPKLSEYDLHGWHANPYIGREFHGVWGNFEVNMSLDATYMVAATGVLQNPDEIGFGYEKPGSKVKKKESGKLTWHWKAENVHDFVWSADPDYRHVVRKMANGPELHFFYQPSDETTDWDNLPAATEKAFAEMNRRFGVYPYPTFSVIQGGDGGMEYPMATLITGNRSFESLVGVTVHEMIHSWYQGVLATDESLYPWMDEGFTSYAESEVMAVLLKTDDDPHLGAFLGYAGLVEAGLQEPLTTHADHYKTNRAYGVNAYSKGELALHQLSYIVGQEVLEDGLRRYFNEWKFKHPTVTDFKRCMEKVSGMELDWYFEYWVHTNETIDYSVAQVSEADGKTFVEIRREGNMPMPVEVVITYNGGRKEWLYIPLTVMYGSKKKAPEGMTRVDLAAWPWTHPGYVIPLSSPKAAILTIEIDPSQRMADIDRNDNLYSEKILVPGPGK